MSREATVNRNDFLRCWLTAGEDGPETIMFGGVFTNCLAIDESTPVATWSGTRAYWAAEAPLYEPCAFCQSILTDDELCGSCGAPTPAWWSRLDLMIATWKRGPQ